MKLPALLLAGSLAANVILVALHLRSTQPHPNVDPSPTALVPGGESTRRLPPSAEAEPILNSTAAQVAALWQQLRTEDLPTMVAKLRAAGFPAAVVRSLIAGEVEARFVSRRQSIIRQSADLPYWTTNPFGPRGLNPKGLAALAELQLEQTKLMKDLLGPSAVTRDGATESLLQLRFGELPVEKYDAIYGVITDYAILRSKLLAHADGANLRPEDRDQMAFLAKEERADLKKILTPTEMEAYELRSSDTAILLRRELEAFKPTESEFRAIFKATSGAEENYGPYQDRENRDKVGGEILERAKIFLSPQRFEEFRRTTNFRP